MRRMILIALMLALVAACGNEHSVAGRAATSNYLTQATPLEVPKSESASQAGPDAQVAPASDSAAAKPTAGRQIIYHAALSLHVKSFADTDAAIHKLIAESGGYLSQFSEDRSYGAQRGGRWTIRVPVDRFTWFLDQAVQLGVAERREVKSQDVTEEYVDLTARMKNKQALESRLLELVASRSDAIKDVLAVETELSRVREEIERLQGRLRYLGDRVALTTIEITAFERLDYQPPEATFVQRLRSTLVMSVDRLRQLAEGAAIVVTALAPWAVVLAVAIVPLGLVVRRRRRERRVNPLV